MGILSVKTDKTLLQPSFSSAGRLENAARFFWLLTSKVLSERVGKSVFYALTPFLLVRTDTKMFGQLVQQLASDYIRTSVMI
jgi:hypothetical protein